MCKELISGIYKIQNIINGKIYIGSSKNIYHRKEQHYSDLKNQKHTNCYLQKAFNKYGFNNFVFDIVEKVDNQDYLLEREQYWLDYYKSYERDKGYNIEPCAIRPVFSEETRLKLRLANLGKKHTQETKEKLSKINKGVKKEQTSKALKQYYKIHKGTMYGKKHTIEAKIKMSLAKKNKPSPKKDKPLNSEQLKKLREKSSKCKKIVCFENLNCYISQTQASEMLGISNKHIGDVCKGRRNITHGYTFMYLDEFLDKHKNLSDKIIYQY